MTFEYTERDIKRAEGLDEAGGRLLAALVSYKLDLTDVDYTLKHYIIEAPSDPFWSVLAMELLTLMAKSSAKSLFGQSSESSENIQ